MWIPFEELPVGARIWIYQSSRPLAQQEKRTITDYLETQIQLWRTHGAAMKASATIFFDRFVVIAADESYQTPSGCSIDASVHWLKQLGNAMAIDFFDRSVAFLKDGAVETVAVNRLKKSVEEGIILADSIVFDNAIQTKGQLEKSWQTEAGKSWMARYFPVNKEIG